MNPILNRISIATLLVAACALPLGAAAQNSDNKRALAVKLAQIQQKNDGDAMAEQLTASAVQPLIADSSQKLDESVPPAKQKDVRDKLDQELKKFSESTFKTIQGQTSKGAEAALVPIFMEKLSEDELKTIIAYLESPAAAKFQSLGPDATNAWAKKVIDATRPSVKSGADSFNAAAARIVGASGGANGKK